MCVIFYICFFKQKTAYEMRISDWSSDVCSSDLEEIIRQGGLVGGLVDGLVESQRKIVELIKANPKISKKDMADNIGISKTAIDKHIRSLKIGRASCRERVCQYVKISVVAGSLKKKNK